MDKGGTNLSYIYYFHLLNFMTTSLVCGEHLPPPKKKKKLFRGRLFGYLGLYKFRERRVQDSPKYLV